MCLLGQVPHDLTKKQKPQDHCTTGPGITLISYRILIKRVFFLFFATHVYPTSNDGKNVGRCIDNSRLRKMYTHASVIERARWFNVRAVLESKLENYL